MGGLFLQHEAAAATALTAGRHGMSWRLAWRRGPLGLLCLLRLLRRPSCMPSPAGARSPVWLLWLVARVTLSSDHCMLSRPPADLPFLHAVGLMYGALPSRVAVGLTYGALPFPCGLPAVDLTYDDSYNPRTGNMVITVSLL